VTVDPILALESLGYTEREAAFLYLVAVHSGYFVRRQFDYFTDRNKGALVMRFLEKARIAGHIEFLDYKQGWHVYHLFSRAIYRLLGNAESQHRRRKGDAQVRARLMALDYVLENDNSHYLESEAERVRFFMEDRRIASELFTGDDGGLYPVGRGRHRGEVQDRNLAQAGAYRLVHRWRVVGLEERNLLCRAGGLGLCQ
jgi:hypothetical protein